ncbi:MAG: substrate-binding domain-containing protein [Halobacteriota archaeon]
MRRRTYLAGAGVTLAGVVTGCLGDAADADATIVGESLTLTTTTSTYDTGLLDELNAAFLDRFGVTVEAVAQGTGAALRTARDGDADVVEVHARSLEDGFMRDGHGVNRRDLMFNDFVVIGPAADPAEIDGMTDATEAFRSIADAEATFISRGDDSGTHAKERDIWAAAGVEPSGEWYREAGSGMGEVLNQADLAPGHTLVDRGTYLARRAELTISIRVEGPIEGGSDLLANPYGIIAVNPGVHADVNYDVAMAYIGFLTSRAGQDLIEGYTVDGEQLFFPKAVAADPNFAQYVPEGWHRDDD